MFEAFILLALSRLALVLQLIRFALLFRIFRYGTTLHSTVLEFFVSCFPAFASSFGSVTFEALLLVCVDFQFTFLCKSYLLPFPGDMSTHIQVPLNILFGFNRVNQRVWAEADTISYRSIVRNIYVCLLLKFRAYDTFDICTPKRTSDASLARPYSCTFAEQERFFDTSFGTLALATHEGSRCKIN